MTPHLHPGAGSFMEERDSIPVEDSSFKAFKVFLDVLYNKKTPMNKAGFKLLGELYSLADKYLMAEMQELIIHEVASRKIVSGVLIEAAKVAEENAHMDELSEAIINICSDFVKDYSQSVLEIVHSEEAGSDRFLVLHRLLGKSSKIISNMCGNCRQNPCLDGKLVTKENYVQNSNVKHIPSPLAVRQSGVKTCYAVVKVTHDDDCLLIGHYCPRNSTVTVVPLSEFKYNCK